MAKKKKKSSKELIEPTAGYVLIEPTEAKEKTESGIYLPESASEEPLKGKVIAVGPDRVTEKGTKIKSPAKKGDMVVYKKWGGNEVKVNGKEFLFAKFEDILGIIN